MPALLFLDEATVGLDVESRLLIISYVRNLCLERGICVLWTTHLMDEVEPSDHLIIINKGEIQAHEQSSTLCEQHNVDDIYQLYFALTRNTEAV